MTFSTERLLLLQRLYRLLTRTALALGDMTLIESACLALAAQQEAGALPTEATAILGIERVQFDGAVALLEGREQVRWERSSRDRRTFAFRITAKGAEAAAFLDEALAIALINRSRFLTEEGFDRLVSLLHQCFAGVESGSDTCLLPAAALGRLGSFGAALAQAGAQLGMPSGQVMTLALLKRAEGFVNATSLVTALDLSLPAVRLQIEGLTEKGLVKLGSSPNEVLLEPSGAQRLEAVLAHEAVGRVRTAFVTSQGSDASRAEAFDELMSLLDYVLDGQMEEVPSVAIAPLGAMAGSRPSTLAALYALLARLFSYPERRQAEDHTSIELLRQVRELLEGLGSREGLPVDVAMRFEAWAAKSPTVRGSDLRAEFTRLFYGYPRLVPLTGSRWVTQGRTEFSLAHGERAAVGLEYRKLGLKNRPGNGDPFDALVSELDFLSYVTSLEARAFEGGDAGSAREWELLRLDFCAHHFGELASGVAQAITQHGDNAFLALYAWLLDLVADGVA